jgi:hypothetical protein
VTTYNYPSDTYYGGFITVSAGDEIVNFHGSGVSIDLFGTAISSTVLDGFETVESGGLDSGSTLDVELTVMSSGTVIGSTIDGVVKVMSGGTPDGRPRQLRLQLYARRRGDRCHARERHH